MKIDEIKKEFPIFDEKIQNNDLVYLDSANSSQKPKVVTDKINEFYTKQFSNVGRSVHYLAVAATNLYENTRTSVQKYINAKDKNEIVFTKGATEALNLVANTLGQDYLQEGDEILITELEHHSNYVPWHFLRKSKNIKINERKISPSELPNFVGCFLTGTAAEVTPVSCIAENKFKVCETIIDLNESYQALVRKKKAA